MESWEDIYCDIVTSFSYLELSKTDRYSLFYCFRPLRKSGNTCCHFGTFPECHNPELTVAATATDGHFKPNQGMEPSNWTLHNEMFSWVFDRHSAKGTNGAPIQKVATFVATF